MPDNPIYTSQLQLSSRSGKGRNRNTIPQGSFDSGTLSPRMRRGANLRSYALPLPQAVAVSLLKQLLWSFGGMWRRGRCPPPSPCETWALSRIRRWTRSFRGLFDALDDWWLMNIFDMIYGLRLGITRFWESGNVTSKLEAKYCSLLKVWRHSITGTVSEIKENLNEPLTSLATAPGITKWNTWPTTLTSFIYILVEAKPSLNYIHSYGNSCEIAAGGRRSCLSAQSPPVSKDSRFRL